MTRTFLLLTIILLIGGCASAPQQTSSPPPTATEIASFAGGCFWCTEAAFDSYPGVVDVVSGFMGGNEVNPTYTEVSSGRTGHYETVQVTFDPTQITYDDLLEIHWRQIDPTDDGGSFVDRGNQYRSVIFYHTPQQQSLAEASKKKMSESGKYPTPIVTQILASGPFYPAEEYHQDFHLTNPTKYKFYRYNSGRDQYREKVWGADKDYVIPLRGNETPWVKPSREELRKRLTPLQFSVTQEDATETPFKNEYWDEKRDGIYVDIVSGEALFSSKDKYDSGTGWPSFTKPLEPDNIVLREDWGILGKRIEVRSKKGNSHLGHVFDDGPAPTGKRYCMNSAAMRFIPVEDLEKEGYGKYKPLFE